MLVVTYATSDQGYFRALEQCCLQNGFQFVVLGWGDKFESFMQKPRAVLGYLKELPDDQMIIIVDAFDVLILQTAEEIYRRYQAITHGKQHPQLVVGVDNLHGPWLISLVSDFLFTCSCAKHNLNAGVMIGTVSAMKRMYELLITGSEGGAGDDDQKILNNTCSAISEHITVDDTGLIIVTTNPYALDSSELIASKPCILHATAEGNLDALCRRFGLPVGLKRNGKNNQTKIQSFVRNHAVFSLFILLSLCVVVSLFYIFFIKSNQVLRDKQN